MIAAIIFGLVVLAVCLGYIIYDMDTQRAKDAAHYRAVTRAQANYLARVEQERNAYKRAVLNILTMGTPNMANIGVRMHRAAMDGYNKALGA